MTTKKAKTYDLAAVIERELGKGALCEVKAGDRTFTIPQRSLWADSAVQAAQNDDPVALAHGLLGADYDGFVAAGGTAMLLMSIVNEALGVDAPE